MDDFASAFLNEADITALPDIDEHEEDGPTTTDSAKKARSLRNGIFRAASIQDKLLEKLLSQVIPAADDASHPQNPSLAADDFPSFAERPGFSVATMSNNFRRFNARIGVVFKFQSRALRVLAWRKPTHTLSLLAVYTFVCLDPYLLFALPLAIALVGIFIPSFVARHPAPTSDTDLVRNLGYSPRGPPLAPARTVKPAKELSRDFFRNMGDLQNVMDDFSVAHDKIIALVVPKTNFSDEALSSAIFCLVSAACCLMLISSHLIPWRYLMLVAGWGGILSGHPTAARYISQLQTQYLEKKSPPVITTASAPTTEQAKAVAAAVAAQHHQPASVLPAFDVKKFIEDDIILDSAPETREVEIFELQRLSFSSKEWEPWLFSPSPYDPLSAARISGARPVGTRFFEDVLAPEGWEWSEKKWALDLWSREWVEERIITGVEVETEGERWVYDIAAVAPENNDGDPVRSANQHQHWQQTQANGNAVSWEEGEMEEDGAMSGRRGEWRRRRWVRLVKRRSSVSGSGN
ncbi:Peroxin/Dysferlin domain-containing protein [Podospora australis]|uniref:Peroxin/Dysferlin domain-containing protein n=1 Tax=Podospora australis TaxID=1536484 RepID=A0AAN7AM60_9PEZI|nr:Peroxin/Dysferlin domain-containing protein [Podospora australis]